MASRRQRVRGTRPVQFQKFLPGAFSTDSEIWPTVVSFFGTTITVSTFQTGDAGFPVGTPVTVPSKPTLRTSLSIAIPPNSAQDHIQVSDATFVASLSPGDVLTVAGFLTRFLRGFEALFEELEASVEGVPEGDALLSVDSVSGETIKVSPFQSGEVGFPAGTPVTVPSQPAIRTTLSLAIPADASVSQIQVADSVAVLGLKHDDILQLHGGGVPDLFAPDTTPPPQFAHRPLPDSSYLDYLASWIALPLRTGAVAHGEVGASFVRGVDWNRRFFKKAIQLYPQRSTLPGINSMLRAWMEGDLPDNSPLLLMLTDLTRTANDVDTVFQLAPADPAKAQPKEVYSQLGLNTVLGEGPPYFFIADLLTNPSVLNLRTPPGLDAFQLAARLLLDAEKPAYTYYQLRIRGPAMQLAPVEPILQTVLSGSGTTINVSPFQSGEVGFPAGTPVTVPNKPALGTTLSQPIPPKSNETQIQVTDESFVQSLQPGDELTLSVWAQLGVTTLLWDDAWVFDSDC